MPPITRVKKAETFSRGTNGNEGGKEVSKERNVQEKTATERAQVLMVEFPLQTLFPGEEGPRAMGPPVWGRICWKRLEGEGDNITVGNG